MKRLALLLVLLPAAAHAGALGRPNLIDARAVGMGGAFTAVADDPSAVWFNPAGLAQLQRTTILAGFDTVAASFDSTPATCSPGGTASTNCPKISTTTALPLPALAFSTRFAGMNGRDPSRVALGFGTFITMGGQVDFNRSQLDAAGETPGILHTKLALFEIVPSIAYKVNEFVSVGASLRAGIMGLGLTDFETTTATRPTDATLTGSGAGFGYALGLLVRPLPALSLGASYRSKLDASVTGNASISLMPGGAPEQATFDLTVPWPQMLSFGVAYRVMPALRLMASYDWTDWSGFDAIAPHFSDSNLDKSGRLLLDYTDNYTIHFGGEYSIGEHAVVRAGYSYDSNAIPDRTQDRQLIDGAKNTVGAGAGVRFGDRLWLDAAGELLFGSTRTVPQSDMALPKYLRNVSPGTYQAQVLSFQLTARYQF